MGEDFNIEKIILLLLFAGLISACSSNNEVVKHDYLFTGEEKYWEAELAYEAEEVWGRENGDIKTYDSEADYTFILTYKGDIDELASINRIDYEYKLFGGSRRTSITFDEPITSKEFTSRGSGGSIMREDKSVHVWVKWDDREESFELVVEQ